MKLYILQYKGLSWISQIIKTVTWSQFSHSDICNIHGVTLEAWEKKGVDLATDPWENHRPGTPISVYKLDATSEQCQRIWNEGKRHVGQGYDFLSLVGFLPILRHFWRDDSQKWFCSHFVAYICRRGGAPLFSQQTPLYKLSPGVIPWSPRLKWIGEVSNLKEFDKLMEEQK